MIITSADVGGKVGLWLATMEWDPFQWGIGCAYFKLLAVMLISQQFNCLIKGRINFSAELPI